MSETILYTNTIDYVNKIQGVQEIKFNGNPELITIIGEDITKNVVNIFSGMYLESLQKLAKITMKQLNHFKDKYYLNWWLNSCKCL